MQDEMKGVRTHSRFKLLESGNDVNVEVNNTTILPIMTMMQIIMNQFLKYIKMSPCLFQIQLILMLYSYGAKRCNCCK